MAKSKNRDYSIPQFSETEVKAAIDQINKSAADLILMDMHCHLDMTCRHFEGVRADLKEKGLNIPDSVTVTDLVQQSANAGISGFLHCGCEIEGIQNISKVLDEIESVNAKNLGIFLRCFGAAAIHPNEAVLHAAGKGGQKELLQVAADGLEPPKLEQRHLDFNVEDAIAEVYSAFKNDSRIRVVGETGLDYFRSNPAAFETQKLSFKEHIQMAKELDAPLQIHDRNAHDDVIKTLNDVKAPEQVLFHSFSGDAQLAQICIDKGYFMSFSGPVTFNANHDLREAFALVWQKAPELILIETDCPFLTPHPYRSRTNAPGLISQTLLFLSNHFEIDMNNLVSQIMKNEANLFT